MTEDEAKEIFGKCKDDFLSKGHNDFNIFSQIEIDRMLGCDITSKDLLQQAKMEIKNILKQ